MPDIARTAVPIVAAALVLTGCGANKPHATAPPAAPNGVVAPLAGSPHYAGGTSGAGIAVDALPSGMLARNTAPSGAPSPSAGAPAASVDGRSIVTRGVGQVSGTPDTVTVVIGVSTQAPTARAALDANNSKANALLDVLRRNGVAGNDVRTSQLSINPNYNDKSTTITGYQVDNTVRASLHGIDKAGALLDAAVGAVGDAVRIQQISFSIGDDSALRAKARAAAVSNAKAQASQLAQAAGVRLGGLRSVTELATGDAPVSYDIQAAAGAATGSVPLQPGQLDITVAVDLVYDIG